jgi:hypothetical protein
MSERLVQFELAVRQPAVSHTPKTLSKAHNLHRTDISGGRMDEQIEILVLFRLRTAQGDVPAFRRSGSIYLA